MKSTLILSALLCISAAACGDSGDPEPTVDASTAARVAATVRYSGSEQGALVLAAFASIPPMGPPMGFAQQAAPTFPASLAIENLTAGSAYVLALLDVAPASPQMPGPEDRTVWSTQLTLALGETESIELVLVDP